MIYDIFYRRTYLVRDEFRTLMLYHTIIGRMWLEYIAWFNKRCLICAFIEDIGGCSRQTIRVQVNLLRHNWHEVLIDFGTAID